MALAHTYEANPHWLPAKAGQDIGDIPGEDGWPLVGNTLKLLRDPGAFGRRMVGKYGRVYRNNAFGGRNIAFMEAEMFCKDELIARATVTKSILRAA